MDDATIEGLLKRAFCGNHYFGTWCVGNLSDCSLSKLSQTFWCPYFAGGTTCFTGGPQ